jgi:hypothetical protein
VALVRFLAASFFYKDSPQYSLRDSRDDSRCSRGGVLGKSSISMHNIGILHLMGRMDLIPWTKWKGVKSVVGLTVVWYAHKYGKNIWFQFLLCF